MDQEKDHPLQAIDTPVPDGEFVDTEAWEAMREQWLNLNPTEVRGFE